jgi:gamma-glutamyltranspeptidase/glutathione hydrolase
MRTTPSFLRKLFFLGLLAALGAGTGTVRAGAAKAEVAKQKPQAKPQAQAKPPAAAKQESSIEYREYAKAARAAARDWPRQAVRGAHGMVVTDKPLASAVGEEILKKGGNAIDAAVAVGFALAVVYPEAGNLGGGGFLLVRQASGKTAFVDYREVAPKKATRTMYLNPDGTRIPGASTLGYRAVGVPGTVAGMVLALHTYGTMKLAAVMAPAIRLAKDGFPVSRLLARDLTDGKKRMEGFATSRQIFLRNGKLYRPGEIFRQPELAATLERIARSDGRDFYRGKTAHLLAADMAAHGGLISLEDLKDYRAKIRTPLEASYRENGHRWEVITSPPPSSGGVAIIEALNILRALPLKRGKQPGAAWSNAENVHYVVEAMRRAFADRAMWLADPDFSFVPVRGLTNPAYAAKLRKTILPKRATPSSEVHAGDPKPYQRAAAVAWSIWSESRGHTTHFSIVDAAGNAVSNTYTINDFFGSGVTSTAGFLLNDEMDDFTTDPGHPNVLFHLMQSEGNTVAPDKRPLSSMVPTMVLRDGKLSLVTGSPGGPRIISATLLSVLNWMRMGMSAQQAIDAPRFHHQWMPDVLYVEPTMPREAIDQLEQRGYKIGWRGWIGQVNAIGIDPRTGERLGVGDPRRHGVAKGY